MGIPTPILTDGYKTDHIHQYPKETALVNSNWTPRKSRIMGIDKVVCFGLQYFIKRFLLGEWKTEFFDRPKAEVCAKYVRRINNYLGPDNRVGIKHIEALHDLGYLPIIIKSLPEGSRSPMRVPQFIIRNTNSDFFWLVNYLETLMSCELWGPATSATIAHQYRLLFEYWAEETGGDKGFVLFQGHDFSMRGMWGVNAAMASGAAHMLSFRGTDTIPAIDWLENYYGADSDKELIGCSVAATEHAVMCVGTGFHVASELRGDWSRYAEAEFEVFKRLITEVYPTGIVSIVSDTWDLWTVLTDYVPRLKDHIFRRNGKLVIRPDSGDPVYILTGYFDNELICDGADKPIFKEDDKNGHYTTKEGKQISPAERLGVIQLLWNAIGGKINKKGFRVLDEHVGAIYGDSITLERANVICERLHRRGYASTNWVAGIGSFTYQYNTRDTFGFAMKATYAEALIDKIVQGVQEKVPLPIEIFKDPITDDGTKKSARGLVRVIKDQATGEFALQDRITWEEEEDNYLEPVFEDGKLLKETTLAEIRQKLWQD